MSPGFGLFLAHYIFEDGAKEMHSTAGCVHACTHVCLHMRVLIWLVFVSDYCAWRVSCSAPCLSAARVALS